MKKLELTQTELTLLVIALVDAQASMNSAIVRAKEDQEKALQAEWETKKEEFWQLERKINVTIYD